MDEFKNNKHLSMLMLIFIAISMIFVFYATVTMRGMYISGAYEMILKLNRMAQSNSDSFLDIFYSKSVIMSVIQLPIVLSHYIFRIENKKALMMIFSCSQLILPMLVLLWNYNLTKRTKRWDILFWSFFVYCLILLPFSIFSITENYLGTVLCFVLWNYLAAKIDYTKKDIVLISLLTVCMFGTYEYVILIGPVFLLAALLYAKKEELLKNKIVKLFVGISIYSVSVFNVAYFIYAPCKSGDVMRFIEEGYNFLPSALHLSISLSILAIMCIILAAFKKNKFSNIIMFIVGLLFLSVFAFLINTLDTSLVPMWEGHFRVIPLWALPLIFIGIYIFDLLNKKVDIEKLQNYFCIVLVCGIFNTCWQCVNTYFWDSNVQYMKQELYSNKDSLYVPAEHEEISNFFNPQLRRYIWWADYPVMSILFSDSYNQKTLLMNYDEEDAENCNYNHRDRLYVLPDEGKISIPYGSFISIKNKFWDLTDSAQALDKYNKDNNIEVGGEFKCMP